MNKGYSKLAILILFCLVLVTARIYYTGTNVYIFLIWNLFLGILPYIFSKAALTLNEQGRKVGTALLILPCILFLPNASYIITDLFHLRTRSAVPIWFDCILIFSFALAGLILFYRSIHNIENILKKHMSKPFTWLITCIVIFASAFGMYLGRYLRFNSWDIVYDPILLLSEIGDRFLSPFDHIQTWSMTLVYGAFLGVLYLFTMPDQEGRT